MSVRRTKLRAMTRAEDAAMQLLYYAEHWATTGATFYDLKRRRTDLLEAARRYGRAMESVARKIR